MEDVRVVLTGSFSLSSLDGELDRCRCQNLNQMFMGVQVAHRIPIAYGKGPLELPYFPLQGYKALVLDHFKFLQWKMHHSVLWSWSCTAFILFGTNYSELIVQFLLRPFGRFWNSFANLSLEVECRWCKGRFTLCLRVNSSHVVARIQRSLIRQRRIYKRILR